MARNWIEFDEPSDRHTTGQLYATMNPKGQILVNRYTYEQMKRPEAVKLYFEPETDSIGLKAANPLMPNSFPFRTNGVSGHRIIFARRFARKHDIRLDYTVSFYLVEIEDDTLILSLQHITKAPRGNHRKSRKGK